MKWIGQHIWDLISRFRNDVYLEDVSSGTIASGGNLGLDSNNKIVKANVPAEHDAVTLAGTLDYITLSGQELTRNQIDLSSDVTGVLPSNQVKQISMSHHHFFMNSASTTVAFFFPYNNLNEASSTSQYYTRTIAPYAGKIVKVVIRPSAAIGTACTLQFHKITDTTLNFGTAAEEVTSVNLNTAETSVSTAFSSATFSAGDVVNVSLIKSDSATANIQAVIVWEYTI